MSTITLRNVSKDFGSLKVLKGLNLEIKSGEFVVVVGPSGCGKSTLLRMIAGLEDFTAGELLIDGEVANHVSPHDRGVAMVFQSYALYPHMTVAQNIGFSLRIARVPKPERYKRVLEAAQILQIEHLLDRKPSKLSGGQRQRVAIGRSIVRDPRIFLFDEPLSNLDAGLRVHMRLELERLHMALKKTMIYVTHDQVEAMTLADRVVVLHDGVIQQIGDPVDLYRNPANRFVAAFIGSPPMNFLQADLDGRGGIRLAGTDWFQLPNVAHKTGAAEFGIRPEHIHPGGEGDVQIEAKVEQVERLGAESLIYARTDGDQHLTLRVAGLTSLRRGDTLKAGIRVEDVRIFSPEGQCLSPPGRRP